MLTGLSQHVPLDIGSVIRRAATVHGDKEVITATATGSHRQTWAETSQRAARLAGALEHLGIGPGDRVGSYAWNTHRHLELYYAVPGMGAVLNTLNIRLFAPEVAWVADHAEDRVIFVDASLTRAFADIRPLLKHTEHVVVMPDTATVDPGIGDYLDYEELLGDHPADRPWDPIDEDAAAILCYTSGTTGRPKGVLYSHRAEVLHAFGALMADSVAVRERDTVLALAPMFHANSWGLAYSAALAGSTLVMAGSDHSSQAIVDLVEHHAVTFAAGIPTLWVGVDRWLAEHPERGLGRLERILCGGAAVGEDLLRRYDDRGVTILQAWGMTELAPNGSIATVRDAFTDSSAADQRALRATAGIPVPGVELRIVDDKDQPLPHDGDHAGELQARGPWVASAYYRPDDNANHTRFHDGWLRTGDIATIDPHGYVRLVDRAKDVIKSGGEWISSLDLENALTAHPHVAEAAVVGVPHPTWSERPIAFVVPVAGTTIDLGVLREHLLERVATWWLPNRIDVVTELPRTSVGKLDKRRLRRMHQDALTDDVVER